MFILLCQPRGLCLFIYFFIMRIMPVYTLEFRYHRKQDKKKKTTVNVSFKISTQFFRILFFNLTLLTTKEHFKQMHHLH